MRSSRWLRELCYTALCGALISVTALISIPLPSAVAITLQTFGIYFSLFFLGGRLGTASTVLYILLGAVGLPLFSGFTGGVSRLFDATGGFIFGFAFAALIYWLTVFIGGERVKILAAVISILALYLIGALWYSSVYLGEEGGFAAALTVCVLPFIIPDAIKISLAYIISKRLTRALRRAL